MKTLKVSSKIKANFSLVVFFAVILVGTLAFLSNLIGRSFNSDDVAEQTMAHNLLMSPHALHFQIDTYILKYPIYWLFGLMSRPSVAQIALESILFNLLMFILLWVWWKNFSPNTRLKWLVFVWFIACGTYWIAQTINPNTRNLELPLMLMVGSFAAKYLDDLSRNHSKLNRRYLAFAAGFAVITGLLIYDDPYTLYFILVPLAIATIIYAVRKRDLWPVLLVSTGLIISLTVFRLMGVITLHFGIHLTKFNEINELSSSVVSASYLPTKILQTLEGYLSFFGVSTVNTSPSLWRFLAGLPGLSVIFLAILALCNIIRKRILSLFNLWVIAVIVFTFLYVIAVGTPISNTARYFIILIPLTSLLAVYGFLDLRKQNMYLYKLAIWLISLSIICSLIVAIAKIDDNHNSKPNQLSYSLIPALKSNGVENAYINYWAANVTYYLSDYKYNVLPTVCFYGKVYKDSALVDNDRFKIPSEKNGIIVTPGLVAPSNSPDPQSPSCTIDATINQFGKPQKIIKLSPSGSLLIYNHPIQIAWRKS